jgi:hypothetical protein
MPKGTVAIHDILYFAATRRAARGMQLRLTPAGLDLAAQRKREMDDVWSMIDLDALSACVQRVLNIK